MGQDKTHKTCSKCCETKPVSEFYRHRTGYRPQCIPCKKETDLEYRTRTQYHRKVQPSKNTLRSYGITLEDYDRMMRDQAGKCAICGGNETTIQGDKTRRMAIDHCHETGKVRGLLCGHCNTFIGMAKENSDYLMSAVMYLREHGSCRSRRG